jgi:hypothetical protein
MNVEAPSSLHHQYPLSSNHKQLETVSNTEYTTCRIEVPVANLDMSQPAVPNLGSFLPALFEQAKSNGGLSSVPQPTLKENLEMVISALERLDAEALLDLKIFPEQRLSSGQQPPGPRVRDGYVNGEKKRSVSMIFAAFLISHQNLSFPPTFAVCIAGRSTI